MVDQIVQEYFEHSQRIREQYEPDFIAKVNDISRPSRWSGEHSFTYLGDGSGLRKTIPAVKFHGEEVIRKTHELFAQRAAELISEGKRAPSFCIGVRLKDPSFYGLITEDFSNGGEYQILDTFREGGVIKETGEKVWYDLVSLVDVPGSNPFTLFTAPENLLDLR